MISSTIISQSRLTISTIESANADRPNKAVSNPRSAPGATSWMSCIIARPSSLQAGEANGGSSGPISRIMSMRSSGGKSPSNISWVAFVFLVISTPAQSNVVDSTHTFVPVPSKPNNERASSTSMDRVASLSIRPALLSTTLELIEAITE